MKIQSIDCGLHGAVSTMITPNGLVSVEDTPIVKINGKNEYDINAMCEMIDSDTDIVVLEVQQAMPRQGLSSTFKTGMGYGIWQGIIVSKGVRLQRVRPPEWKKYFGLLKTDKKASIARAKEMFPALADQLKASKDGRADALLMAEWMRKNM